MKRPTVVLLSAILAVLVVIAVVLIIPLVTQPQGCDRFASGSDDYYLCRGNEIMQNEG